MRCGGSIITIDVWTERVKVERFESYYRRPMIGDVLASIVALS